MRTPEQIAEPYVNAPMADGKAASVQRWVLAQTIVNAVRDAQRDIAPSFKPDDQPDKYRDVWGKIDVAPDFLADLYVLKISAHQTRSGDSASTGSLTIGWQQARRILATLSEESEA